MIEVIVMSKTYWDSAYNRNLPTFTQNPVYRLNAPNKVLGYVLKHPREEVFGEDAKHVPRGSFVTARIRVQERNCEWDSDPMREHPDEHYDATFGLMLYHRMEGFGSPGNGRWFSRERIKLRPGVLTCRVQLQPENWSNVWGKVPPDNEGGVRAWEQTLLRPIQIGVSFGGKFYGHGVAAKKGLAVVKILSVTVSN